MNDTNSESPAPKTPPATHEAPPGAEVEAVWPGPDGDLSYGVSAGWTVLYKNETPAAEVFSIGYVAEVEGERPVTFVFNGGPGASSAYLHMGAVGPRMVAFPPDGSLPPPPARLVDNQESWLGFTDLVFIDPVGTGFSRVIESKEKGDDKPADAPDAKEFFVRDRDLQSMGEFIQRWLSANDRWGSPVFIAGESYGGFRAAKMARVLQQDAGVGINGAILISPALEFDLLSSSDYDVLAWVDRLPTMALAAAFHGRSRAFASDDDPAEIRAQAEAFATGDYTLFLTRGAAMDVEERTVVLNRLGDLIGVDPQMVERMDGRVGMMQFVREVRRDERRVLGLYDATMTAIDPFPDREPFAGPDPTLAGTGSFYTAAINRLIRTEIGVESEREYRLLNFDVFQGWKMDPDQHAFQGPGGATDDFRYGMSLNPHMKAFVTHGVYDLVTPYYASERLLNLMRLDPDVAARIETRHFDGGHMFYAWEESRRLLRDAIADFVADALHG